MCVEFRYDFYLIRQLKSQLSTLGALIYHENEENLTRNGSGVDHFHLKSTLTNFQTLAHKISLLAGLHTLSNLFTAKLKKPILRHLSLFRIYFIFHQNFYLDALRQTLLES